MNSYALFMGWGFIVKDYINKYLCSFILVRLGLFKGLGFSFEVFVLRLLRRMGLWRFLMVGWGCGLKYELFDAFPS